MAAMARMARAMYIDNIAEAEPHIVHAYNQLDLLIESEAFMYASPPSSGITNSLHNGDREVRHFPVVFEILKI